MHLVVFADFNCPYSYLASVRSDRAVAAGLAEIEWRMVEHDPSIPHGGDPLAGERSVAMERELEDVTSRLREGEELALSLPPVYPNSAVAIGAFAAADSRAADRFRAAAFEALWSEGRDIGDPSVVAELARDAGFAMPEPGGPAPAQVTSWRREWVKFESPIVPSIVLPDGYVSRGLGALKRLGDLVYGPEE